jgi:hypothetical protein
MFAGVGSAIRCDGSPCRAEGFDAHGNSPMVAVWPGAPQYLGSHTSHRSQDLPSARHWSWASAIARRRETFQRLDAAAGAGAHFQRAMMMDFDQVGR